MRHGAILWLSIIFLLSVSVSAWPDTLNFKDGKKMEGEIVRETEDAYYLVPDVEGARELKFNKDQIRSVRRDTPEEKQRRFEKKQKDKGLVKYGDQWITPQEADRLKAEGEQKAAEQEALRQKMEALKKEQEELQRKAEQEKSALQEASDKYDKQTKNVLKKVAFFAVVGVVVLVLVYKFFGD